MSLEDQTEFDADRQAPGLAGKNSGAGGVSGLGFRGGPPGYGGESTDGGGDEPRQAQPEQHTHRSSVYIRQTPIGKEMPLSLSNRSFVAHYWMVANYLQRREVAPVVRAGQCRLVSAVEINPESAESRH